MAKRLGWSQVGFQICHPGLTRYWPEDWIGYKYVTLARPGTGQKTRLVTNRSPWPNPVLAKKLDWSQIGQKTRLVTNRSPWPYEWSNPGQNMILEA